MHMRFILTTLAVSFFLVRTQTVFAHGTGVSFEEKKEGYTIDIGHEESIAALESTRLDFALYPEDVSKVEGEVFTDAWVTITKDKKLFFGGAVDKPVFGATGFTFVFPEAGTYTIASRFQKDGETVVKSEFPLEIISPLDTKKEVNPSLTYVLLSLGSLCVGLCIGFLIPKKSKK